MSPFQPLQLPNGTVLPNRIAKAAMEENMAELDQSPSDALMRLYQAWAEGGAGLILSGNVMIDGHAMTGPGGVVLQDETHLEKFRTWARIGQSRGAQFWLQINHPGRQMRASLGQTTYAPSAVALQLGRASKMFAVPEAMSEAKIADVIERFARTASLARKAGFDGVEIHAAHGYLISQFLSPLSNRREDRWGGTLENRARLLLEVVRSVRRAVGPDFAVAVKLNSADFQRGGFMPEEALAVTRMLNELDLDLLELSGGNYEIPVSQGEVPDGSSLAREAYFLDFAKEIAAIAKMPVMTTGGIRRLPVVEAVLASGVAMAGVATAMAINPGLPNAWRAGQEPNLALPPVHWKSKQFSALAAMCMVKYQLRRLSRGNKPDLDVAPWKALLIDQFRLARRTRRYRQWTRAH